ncbi:polymer-forming cytoskeletal protein [Cupriavidus necator]|uniref:bactofilin family protein n=1 Tax=Cupriavidus necator TaxID=106590 RepID=UPI0039C00512
MEQPISISVLNYGICIHGDVVADHGISCGGLIEGSMTVTRGLLHVAAGAVVRGRAEGQHVLVEGTVEGGVAARESLVINGRVKGDIVYAGTIRLGPNAMLEGKVTRTALPDPASLATETASVASSPFPESQIAA